MKLISKQTSTRYAVAQKNMPDVVGSAGRCTLRLAAFVLVCSLPTDVWAQSNEPKVVALTTNSCPVVSDGDTVTFEWNPAFAPSSDVKGLIEFDLGFARTVAEDHVRGHVAPLQLAAHTRVHSPIAEGSAINGETNGFYQIRFRIHSSNLPPGTYELVEASAIAKVDSIVTGDGPQMTNSPLQSHFCLELTAAPRHRGGL